MTGPRYPSLYQINTRVWLHELGASLGRPATLGDVPDASLDRIATDGFDWLWLLGVWQTGTPGGRSRSVSRTGSASTTSCCPTSPPADVGGSPFAVREYSVHADFGGPRALEVGSGSGLPTAGIRLMLDFVPNHTALDHPWVREHPEYYVRAPRRTSPASRTTIAGSRPRAGRGCWPTAATRTSPAGPTPSSSNYRHPALRGGDGGRADAIAGAVRRRAVRHGHAAAARRHRADLGRPVRPATARRAVDSAVLAGGDRAGAARRPGFVFMAEVILGPGMGPPAAGLRLHLRQAALRPAARARRRRRCAATCMPTPTTSGARPASWRTTTSRGRRRRSRRRCTRRPR